MDDVIIDTAECEALAETWASIDGRLKSFEDGRTGADHDGRYAGYLVEAAEMIRRLRSRGFDVTAVPKGSE